MAGREDTAAPVSTGAACLLTPQRELRRESPHRTSTTEACALGVERLELPLTYGELPTVYSEMAHTIHDTQGTHDRGERIERTRGTRTSRHEGRECRE